MVLSMLLEVDQYSIDFGRCWVEGSSTGLSGATATYAWGWIVSNSVTLPIYQEVLRSDEERVLYALYHLRPWNRITFSSGRVTAEPVELSIVCSGGCNGVYDHSSVP